MDNYKKTMLERSSTHLAMEEQPPKIERRFLVIGLFLSYPGCLATLWYIWNAPAQGFDTFWLQFARSRFTLILIPFAVLCACYLRLRHITGDILKVRGKRLDERQRMVRDQAYRVAYKFIALICLLMLAFLSLQNILASTPAPATPASTAASISIPSSVFVRVGQTVQVSMEAQLACGVHPCPLYFIDFSGPAPLHWTFLRQPSPVVPPPPHTMLTQGLLYGLLLITLIFIMRTLPNAIIAWKERR